jgi:gliding motility-associated-like protein
MRNILSSAIDTLSVINQWEIRIIFRPEQVLKFILVLLFLPVTLYAQKDFPSAPADIQTIPAGSFIIPMDTTLQNIVPAGQAPFNLKAYGLVNEFLQNGIPVKWVIRSGKDLNDIDFTSEAERFSPSYMSESKIDFRGGPFIVPDTVVPCGLSTSQIIQKYGNNVTAYRMVNAAAADVKYTLTHRPKIAVFNNGGNQLIHTRILDAAGITDYDVMDAADIANLINCYTFVSEPHAEVDEVSQEVINGVKAFVLNGGNFLAQCHAIETYEGRGLFQTTAGIIDINTTVDHLYNNPDMSFSQIHGNLQENEGGSIHNWTLDSGSNWKPETYKIVSHLNSDTVVATGAHLTGPSAPGGNVFYLGGHDYSKGGKKGSVDLTKLARVNALRMYLNAALIPSGNSNGAWARAGEDATTVSCHDSVTLGCTLTGPPGSSFVWTPAAGLSCTDCPNPAARPGATTSYIVKVTNGCIATDTVTVYIPPAPVAKFDADKVCTGRTTTFTNESLNAVYFKWKFEGPDSTSYSFSDEKKLQYRFSKAGAYKVTLIAGTDSACADTIIKEITVDPSPVININSPLICKGNSVVLKASGAETYKWPDGETGNSVEVKPLITTTYKVSGVSAEGCITEGTAVVTVVNDITGNISTRNVSCYGLNDGKASVEVSGGKPGFNYLWNTVPEQKTAEISGLKPGKYQVVITDSAGCSDTADAIVAEPQPLNPETKIKHVTCNAGNNGYAQVSVTGGTLPYLFTWNTSPVKSSAEAENLTAGIYIVSVKDSNGCTTTDTITIKEPAPFSKNSAAENVKCPGGSDGTASVNISGGSSPYYFSWKTSPVQTTQIASGLSAGVYTVIVTDSAGCTDSLSVTVTQPAPLKLQLTLQHPECSKKGSASVTVTGGTQPYSYHWNTSPVQNTSAADNLSHGTYNLKITDANKCSADTLVTLYDPPLPEADFSPGNICAGQSVSLNNQSYVPSGHYDSRIVSWQWFSGDMNIPFSYDQQPVYTFANDGFYNLKLVVTTDKNCTDTAVVVAEAYPLPEVDFSFTGKKCAGECISFTDLSSVKNGKINSWFWNFGDPYSDENSSVIQNPVHCYGTSGRYPVTLSVTSIHGCSASETRSDYVDIKPLPQTDLGPEIKICTRRNSEARVPLKAANGVKYFWSPTGDTTEMISVNIPGMYKVTVTNEWECITTDSVNIRNVCPPEVYTGNAFSPDNDGINDYFTFYTTNVGKFQLLIFNRWGEIIFESTDKNHFWDGIYRMEPMPVGVYAWVLTYEGDSEEYLGPYNKKGSITIVR